MSISVVTVRDDSGAPSTREVYAGAARYTIGNGNLEILSPEPRQLATYPSGNWLSVYIGDVVKVLSAGSEDAGDALESADTTRGLDSAVDLDAVADAGADADIATDIATDFATDSAVPDVVAEPQRYAEPDSQLDEADEPEPVMEAGSAGTDADPSADAGSAPDGGVEPVVGQPPTGEPVSTDVNGSGARTELPPGMRPVVFRHREFKAPPSKVEAPAGPRMMPVVFAPKAMQPPRSKDPVPAKPRMMPVVFRSRAARATPPTQEETVPANGQLDHDERGGPDEST